MDVASFAPILKSAPHVLFAVAIASGVALFAPPVVIGVLGFESIMANHRGMVGLAFVGSTTLFCSALGARLFGLLRPVLLEQWHVFLWKRQLTMLSAPEKRLLAEYLRRNTTTLSQEISCGIAKGLEAKHILYRASNMSHPGSRSFDYNVQPWAWSQLKRRPALLTGVEDTDQP